MKVTGCVVRSCALLFSTCLGAVESAQADTGSAFQRGHVFVSVREPEVCDFGGREWIVEIDPETGDWSVFADSDDGLCGVSGLRFTPDGSRLLALSYGHFFPDQDGGWVQSFAPDGTSEIVLDESDGLMHPLGANALTFNETGDLYLLSGNPRTIRVFPSDGSPPWTFADSSDSVSFRGALNFGHGNELLFGGWWGNDNWWGNIVRFSYDQNGEAEVFPGVGGVGMAVDRHDNVYVARQSHVVRMPDMQIDQEELFADGFFGWNGVAVNAPGTIVYVVDATLSLFAIDAETREKQQVADFSSLSWQFSDPAGITVFAPIVIGDVDSDGDVDTQDVALLVHCFVESGESGLLPTCYPSDFNRDLAANLADFAIIQREYRPTN